MRSLAILLIGVVVGTACGDDGIKTSVDAPLAGVRAVAVAGDFTAPPGVISALSIDALTVQQNVTAGVVGDDPQLRHLSDVLYVIDRDTNNVTALDATTLSLIGQLGTGTASNPQDVAVVGDTLFIPVLGGSGVVYGTIGDATVTPIDLAAAVGDPDGKPDCTSAIAVGTDVYVGCGALASFVPRGNGVLVVIDATTHAVKSHIALPAKNPQALTKMMGGAIIMTTFDTSSDGEGCTIAIAPGATPTAACIAMNRDLGGGPISFDVSGTTLWIAYASADFMHAWVRSFETTASTFGAKLTPDTQIIHDVAVCPDGKVVVADAPPGTAGGLRVYAGTTELTTTAVPLGIPPVFGDALVCY